MDKNPFYRIKSVNDPWYNPFYEIYRVSFPLYEQRSESQQKLAFQNDQYHLLILFNQEEIGSFIAYWDFDSYCYIEHLAVNPRMRGQNIGSKTLSAFSQFTKKTIILEIDPIIDPLSEKRYLFYKKLGYRKNSYTHFHPSYKKEFSPHELLVLSLPEKLPEEQYEVFRIDLNNIVMKFE